MKSEEIKYKITIKSFFGHLHTVNKRRFNVFKLCCKAGIPWQGLVHDLSKYSLTEFLEGAKYYTGGYSPIQNRKKNVGYSEAWLHHKGRNKHHYEYWFDNGAPLKTPIIPFKYFVEMICDTLAAGLTYQGNKWTKDYQLAYWTKTSKTRIINPKMEVLVTKVYEEIAESGIDKVLRKEHLRKLYDKYTN